MHKLHPLTYLILLKQSWLGGRVLLLHPKSDRQHRRNIGGDAIKRRHSMAGDLLRHDDGGAGIDGAGATSIPRRSCRKVASRLTGDWQDGWHPCGAPAIAAS